MDGGFAIDESAPPWHYRRGAFWYQKGLSMRNLLKGAGIAAFWLLAGLAVFLVAMIGFILVDELTQGNRQAASMTFYVVEIIGQIALAALLSPSWSLRGILSRALCQGLHVTVASLYLMTYPLKKEKPGMLAIGLFSGVVLALMGHCVAHIIRVSRA
jgi:hypothetical protein